VSPGCAWQIAWILSTSRWNELRHVVYQCTRRRFTSIAAKCTPAFHRLAMKHPRILPAPAGASLAGGLTLMASIRQIEANRLNAKKPPGPRTAEGKSRSRMNALKSGIDAQAETIPTEDPDALQSPRRRIPRALLSHHPRPAPSRRYADPYRLAPPPPRPRRSSDVAMGNAGPSGNAKTPCTRVCPRLRCRTISTPSAPHRLARPLLSARPPRARTPPRRPARSRLTSATH